MPRWAAKTDDNQKDIVKALRKLGYSVELDHDDILVGTQGRTFWYEIKNVNGRNRNQKGQTKLSEEFKGHYRIVRSLDEILADLKLEFL